jgi:hypothetical protein
MAMCLTAGERAITEAKEKLVALDEKQSASWEVGGQPESVSWEVGGHPQIRFPSSVTTPSYSVRTMD